jgi:uncharacterized protein (DUF488 family)
VTEGRLFTIGHSTHEISTFLDLLAQHHVTAVADVRSVPSSRHRPHFNRRAIERSLDAAGIKYVFLGRELGARSDDPTCYVGGRVQYDRLARTPEFKSGIERLLKGAREQRIAIMCAEAEPLQCHRTVLVARVLQAHGAAIGHIHRDGRVERHETAMNRLMCLYGLNQADLFHSAAELLTEALSRQENRIAYVKPELGADTTAWR